MGEVTTSIVVQFGTLDATGILSAEIDGRADGYNKGKTSFFPGDDAYYLLYTTASVSQNLITQEASYGSVISMGSGTMEVTEILTYAGSNVATSSKPVKSLSSFTWLGKSLGSITVTEENQLVASTTGVGALKVVYTTGFEAFKIASPATMGGESVFSIVVYITGNASIDPIV